MTLVVTSPKESEWSLMWEMAVHRNQTMGWQSECCSCLALGARMVLKKGRAECSDTGGEGSFTQWVHCEFIVSFEAIRLVITQQVCGEFFQKVPTKVPTGYFLNETPGFVSKEPTKIPIGYFLNKRSEFFQKVPINLIKMYPTIYLAGSL